MIVLISAFEKKMPSDPWDPSSDCLNASFALHHVERRAVDRVGADRAQHQGDGAMMLKDAPSAT